MAGSHEDLLRRSNQVCVQFLLTDVETGLTFLDVARTTAQAENRERNLQKARLAYDTVRRLLPRVKPEPEEKRQLDERMELLRKRLIEAGVALEPEEPAEV